jgi:uncharacterized membrane protein YeaQ/YmgE (transglycosylase-associated protein family)
MNRWLWACLLLPLLAPALLVSYTYAPLALALTAHPQAGVVFYCAMLVLKLAPLAAVARIFFPPRCTPEGQFCFGLEIERTRIERWIFRLGCAGRAPWLVLAIIWLLAFTDFELASLWVVTTWTVRLFDAQTGGFSFDENFLRLGLPLAIELAVLAAVVCGLREPLPPAPERRAGGRVPLGAMLYLGVAVVFAAAGPLGWVAAKAWPALRDPAPLLMVGGDIAASVVCGVVGAAAGWFFSGLLGRGPLLLAGVLPGLCGALVLALWVLAVFQTWVLRPLYDTPLPLGIALALWLAPMAALLRFFLRWAVPAESVHLARMAGSRALLWRLAVQPRVAALGLLFLLGYFEFTASSILAPTGMTPAFVRLHNLAHYGQTAVLSAMLLAATAAPAMVLALTMAAGRLYARRR